MHKIAGVKNSLNHDEKLFSLSEENNKSKSAKNVEIKKETQELRQNEAQQIKEPEPSYYAVIPANVRYDTRLSPLAKLLYGEITCLCQKEGFCWATNSYFAKLYQKSKVWISNVINLLAKCGYISIELQYKEGTKEIKTRYISLKDVSRRKSLDKNATEEQNFNTPIKVEFNTPIKENFNTPIKENFKGNNTSINNINIKKVSKKERQLETDKNLIGGAKNNSISISEKKESKNKKIKLSKAKKAKPKPSSFDAIIDAYTESEDLRIELKEHLKTRKQKKTALNNRAIELSLKKLDKLADSDEEKLLIVQNSIMNGWVGFFPLKQDEKKQLRDKSSYDLDEYMKTMDTFGSEPKGDPKRFPFELGNWL